MLTVMLNRLFYLVLQFVNLVREFLIILLVIPDLSNVLIDAIFLTAKFITFGLRYECLFRASRLEGPCNSFSSG